MKLTLVCESCGQSMKLNEKIYEKHIQKYHTKKVNNKELFLKTIVRRRK